MNAKTAILVLLLASVLLVGCASSQPEYATYGQQQQQQYVGGGCGVAPSADYEAAPIQALDSGNSAL